MTDPLLSVLLPCCNGGAALGPALQSILAQTFGDFELLFLNDGSTDQSVEMARAFNDPRIRILGGAERCGLPIRLNQGVAQARGQFVARMDADDISFPQRFEKQLAYLLGLAEATISRWETGAQIQQRSLDNLLRIFFGFPEVRKQIVESNLQELGLVAELESVSS